MFSLFREEPWIRRQVSNNPVDSSALLPDANPKTPAAWSIADFSPSGLLVLEILLGDVADYHWQQESG